MLVAATEADEETDYAEEEDEAGEGGDDWNCRVCVIVVPFGEEVEVGGCGVEGYGCHS